MLLQQGDSPVREQHIPAQTGTCDGGTSAGLREGWSPSALLSSPLPPPSPTSSLPSPLAKRGDPFSYPWGSPDLHPSLAGDTVNGRPLGTSSTEEDEEDPYSACYGLDAGEVGWWDRGGDVYGAI